MEIEKEERKWGGGREQRKKGKLLKFKMQWIGSNLAAKNV